MMRIRTSVGAVAVLFAAGLPMVAGSPAVAAGPCVPGSSIPWDFNGDGAADLAVGAPGDNLGSSTTADAGSVTVFLANPTTGAYTSSTVWTQDSVDVPDKAQAGDQFGFALTSGDYDDDGCADLAVAANKEDIGSGGARKNVAGLVTVLWGSATGIDGAESKFLVFSATGTESAGAFAGDALASGDFDGDGTVDLAVGAPGIERVRIYTGTTRADFGTVGVAFGEATAGVPGTRHLGTATRAGDLFGEALAVGDFDNDGNDDLVVGAPYDYDDTGYAVGSVTVIPGSDAVAGMPIDIPRATRWTPDTAGVLGRSHPFSVNDLPDSFGRTLATGDLNNDEYDDLVVGIPGSPVARTSGGTIYQDAGRVQIFHGSAAGVTGNDLLLSQETAGIGSSSETGDLFGASLDAGNGPGATDVLAIGSAEEIIWVLPSETGAGARALSENSDGIWGNVENEDSFGAFVRFLDNGPTANEALAVSAPGEHASAGAVFVLPSDGTLPIGTGSRHLDQDNAGVGGNEQSGAGWGWLGDSH